VEKIRSAFRFLFRFTAIWLVDAVSLSLTAWFLPGIGLGGHAGFPAEMVVPPTRSSTDISGLLNARRGKIA